VTLSKLGATGLFSRKEPRLDGYAHPAFGPVADALGRLLASYGGGGAVCVYHHGECVVDVWGGVRDAAGNRWQRDTMSPSFSTTKGVASTLLHMLVDRGLLDYDDRVAEYWPEFAQAGKASITVRQVMAHQSGLYHIRQMIDHADRMRDWDHVVAAIERARPVHAPGARTGYHGLTYGFLVGELIQRVTGEPFSKLVQREIAEPLALDGCYVGAPRAALARAAELMWPTFPLLRLIEPGDRAAARLSGLVSRFASGVSPLARMIGLELDLESLLDALAPRGISAFEFGSRETLSKTIPSANGLFTARSLARMYAALADGGTLDGVRLLSRATLVRATEIQPPASGRRAVIPFDMRWRLGYHGVATSRGVLRRAYGHFGFGGSGAWGEPNRRLAVALIVNSGMGTPFGDLRIVRIGGTAVGCADARSPRTRADRVAAADSVARARKTRRPETTPTFVRTFSARRKAASGRRSR
jgi:CubicO group peptidase (beta-lactamase class C family)